MKSRMSRPGIFVCKRNSFCTRDYLCGNRGGVRFATHVLTEAIA